MDKNIITLQMNIYDLQEKIRHLIKSCKKFKIDDSYTPIFDELSTNIGETILTIEKLETKITTG